MVNEMHGFHSHASIQTLATDKDNKHTNKNKTSGLSILNVIEIGV